jgi:hypothetical protein
VALPLANSAEGGTNGTTVTTGNSGGTSGNAWNAVTVSATCTAVYSSSRSMHGSLSYALTTGTTAGEAEVGWTTSVGTVTTFGGRVYVNLSAAPAASDANVQIRGTSASNGGNIQISTGRVLILQTPSFSNAVTFTTVMATSTWYRIEWKMITGSAGSASFQVSLFTGDSVTATETHTDSTNAWGGTGGVAECNFGWTNAHANQPTLYMDDIQCNATGLPGPVSTTHSGAAALTGSGSMSAAWQFEETVALAGSGTLGATGIAGILAMSALSGTGSLTATGVGGNVSAAIALSGSGVLGATSLVTMFQSALSGTGSMTAARGVTWVQFAGLSGTGLLSAGYDNAQLDGEGELDFSGLVLGYVIGLSGTGSFSVPQVTGGLVSGSGGVPSQYALPGTSQVAVAPPGSSSWQYLGTLGQVTSLVYGYACPGGCDKMSTTILVPAAYRTQLFNPGWKVRITRGGHQVWSGKLDEPAPSPSGWALTAVGTGNRGTDFVADYFDTWPAGEPDESVNRAINRGLPWVNPGIGTPSGMWLGQAIDTGAQTVTALLTLVCTRGGLTWYVNSQPGGSPGDDLSVFPLPTVPNRLLVSSTPVARTLGGDINTIFIRYQSAADNATTGAAAVFSSTSVQNVQDVAAHQVTETYIDLSSAGTLSQAAAQAVGSSVLQVYQRASFAGPFTVSYGELLTTGGTPIDPGTDQAGTMVRLLLTDFGYGGEATPQFPVTFIVGAYEWDDFAQVATVTPYQIMDESLTGMLSMVNTTFTPIAAA